MKDITFYHPFDYSGSFARLCQEFGTHKKLVIGFDFDNTIFDVNNRGGDYSQVVSILRRCKQLGWILCLYTAELREDWLKWKIDYCKHFGIEPDYVNESPLIKGTKKPFFNLLLDDRAGLEEAYTLLVKVINYADSKSNQQEKE